MRTNEDQDLPWDHNPEMRIALEDAGWRYARMIGIVESDNDMDLRQLEHDLANYKKYLPNEQGLMRTWNVALANSFVHLITGVDLNICDQWLEQEWS